MKINNILCEYLKNPIGIDIRHPRITWNEEGLIKQSSFEIRYRINENDYKTVSVKSDAMNYTFNDDFKSRDIVKYQIRIYDENNNASDFSEEQSFELGLLNKEDFKAAFITGDYKVNKKLRYPVDCFQKEFEVKNIKKARLYITSCGLYEASINGQRVGEFILAPGSTDYRKRFQYQTYDVTSLLKEGKNRLNVLLADGWYRGSIGAKGFVNVFGTVTRLFAQLEITDNNNKVTSILSDESFNWSNDGPIVFADLKDGEIIDNNLSPSYKGHAKATDFKANMTASNNEAVIENETTNPVSSFVSKSGKTIYEFKYNLAGYISFKCNAKKGDKIKIVLGEKLDADKEVTLKNIQCNTKGRLSPLQQIIFTCKEGENEYKTKFFFGGFKYASVESDVTLTELKQIALYTRLRETSSFECSNNLINIFVENTLRSLKSNSIDIPTDCPTRERMGWTGDSQVFFNTASYLTDYASFARKHIVDVYDRQDKNGRLPQIAPYSAEDWFMDVMNGSVGWADVGVLIPYRFYKKYGDIRLLTGNYDNMVRYAKFMIKRCGPAKGLYSFYARPLHLSKENRKFGVNTGQSYGEWAEPTDVKPYEWTDFAMPHPEESMAYTSYILSLMVEIGNIINRHENDELFTKYSEGVKKAYQELVTKPKFTLDTDRQAKLVRPIYMHLLTEEQEKYAKERLIKALDNYGWRLGTGFLSTPFILDVLDDIDIEYAYKLLENEKMPGWLYMAIHNTGTIWEDWEGPSGTQGGIASLNHYSKGAVVEWLFHGMCGINIVSENRFEIKPVIGGNETYARASYDSIYGTVKSSWERKDNNVIIHISIPSNTTALFKYNGEEKKLSFGDYTFTY